MTAPRPTASAAVTALVVVAAALAVLAVLTGRVSLIVTHGVSMEPLYHQGDLVVAVPADSYVVGDIIAFDRKKDDGSTLEVLHRIIASDVDGFTTQGDNNQSIDPGVVALREIHGRAVLHVPRAGVWVARAGSPIGVGVVALGALLLAVGGGRRRRGGRRSPSARGRPLAASAAPKRHRPGSGAVALSVVVVLAAAGAGLAVSGWTAALDHRTTTTETHTRTASLSYTADVRRSPVYDGLTVSSPTPVFRAVATDVEVKLEYRGVPGESGGTVTWATSLAGPGGWTATVPLSTARRYSGRTASLLTPLDLDALMARSQAAAEITGLGSEPLAVTVLAVITPEGADPGVAAGEGGPVRVSMPLTLTNVQLTAPEDVSDLTSTVDLPRTVVSTTPGEVTLLGKQLPVRSVRIVAVLLLLLSAVGGAAMAARRVLGTATVPSEADRVAARIGDRLVVVAAPPDAADGADAPPGAVNVADPQALVRLAAAHEVPVLHWRRRGTAVFSVNVAGVSYYCTAALGSPSTRLTTAPRHSPRENVPLQRGPSHALRR